MRPLSNKTKHYGLIALKVLILGATFLYIFNRLSSLDQQAWHTFREAVSGNSLVFILLFVLLASINWSLELVKWRTLVNVLKKITFRESARQCLSALSASLWTPNRIGEYGVKPLFFPKEERKKVMVLNLFSNLSQLFATILFGIPGLVYVLFRFDIEVAAWKPLLLLVFVLGMLTAGYVFRKRELLIRGLSLQKLLDYFRSIPLEIRMRVVLLSVLRYVVFTGLFCLLLGFFGIDIPVTTALPLVTSMYLIASVLPSFFFTEVAIKGGVALWLFSHAGYDEIAVLCTVTAMWLLNFVLPAILGSFFVGKFKTAAS